MNAVDVVRYGQATFLAELDAVPESAWETPGVCGQWSVKEILAHIVSYEWLLSEICDEVQGQEDNPTLHAFRTEGVAFNDRKVSRWASVSVAELRKELTDAHVEALATIQKFPPGQLEQPGRIPWYGEQYSLDDLMVYMSYGHKREHAAQIAVFRDQLAER